VIKRHGSGGHWEDTYGYSRVVQAGPWLLVAGCTANTDGVVEHAGDAYEQAVFAFGVARDALAGAGAEPGDVVRTRMYVVGSEHADAVGRAHAAVWGAVRPVATMVMVERLLDPEMLVEVEVEAYRS
jgi:enamine deaminase RidA (YjgF/YER057c/UK114 family)